MEACVNVARMEHVSKSFATEPPVVPLIDVDLEVPGGQVVAITGVSGKGKSTLLNVLGGLMRPDKGAVWFMGENLTQASAARIDALHKQGIGFAFQTPYLFSALTARENLEFSFKLAKRPDPAALAQLALEDFGLSERGDHMPFELSAGQKRRLAIARALGGDHRIILADEPTNDLDQHWADYVFERFAAFAHGEANRAVVVVTHDPRYAQKADVVYALEDGRLTLRR